MNEMTTITPGDIGQMVRVSDGQVVADSRDVARAFGKRHTHVLRSIGELTKSRPDLEPTFGPKVRSVVIGSGARRTAPYYEMTRKGFVVLVGGFTGPRALDFRIAFYDAFERLEARIAAMLAEEKAAHIEPAPSIMHDHDRLRTAISFVRAAHLAKRCPVAKRAWIEAGLPDVFEPGSSPVLQAPADPNVERWFEERTEPRPGNVVATSWLFEDYQYWCERSGLPAYSLAEFGRHLSRIGVTRKMSNGAKRLDIRLRPMGA